MKDEWHFANGDVSVGPISFGELRRLASHGAITGEALVWKDGMGEWTKAACVPGIFNDAALPPRPLCHASVSTHNVNP